MPAISTHSIYFDFREKNTKQIKALAAALCFHPNEVESHVFECIQKQLHHFDHENGSLEAFVFGRVRHELKRFNRDRCHQALSLDSDTESGRALITEVEYHLAEQKAEECDLETAFLDAVPGLAQLRSLASAASGKSIRELANQLGVTPRRLNQIMQKQRRDAAFQSSFDFLENL